MFLLSESAGRTAVCPWYGFICQHSDDRLQPYRDKCKELNEKQTSSAQRGERMHRLQVLLFSIWMPAFHRVTPKGA
jgi:hypothetical protein